LYPDLAMSLKTKQKKIFLMFVFSAFFFFLGDQIVAIKNLTLPNIEQKPSSHLLNNASEEVSLMILYKKKKIYFYFYGIIAVIK
jgi:hypothetical protein